MARYQRHRGAVCACHQQWRPPQPPPRRPLISRRLELYDDDDDDDDSTGQPDQIPKPNWSWRSRFRWRGRRFRFGQERNAIRLRVLISGAFACLGSGTIIIDYS